MRNTSVSFYQWPRLITALIIFVLCLGFSFDAYAGPLQQRTLSVNPTSGKPGSTVTIGGSGWAPAPNAQPYEIHWDAQTGSFLGNFSPNPNGAFSTSITIPAGATAGQHLIWACQRCGSGKDDWQSVGFTVIVPSTPIPATPTPTPTPTRIPTRCDPSGAPGELVVDFEDIVAGEIIKNVLLPEGVSFALEYPTIVSFWGTHSGSKALANGYSAANEFHSAGTPLVMQFQNIQDFVGVFVGSNEVENSEYTATLTAYGEDEAGNPIVVGTDSETLRAETNPIEACLWVEAPGQIIKATVNYGPGASVGASELIDDLILRGPETAVPVPEDDTPPVVTIEDLTEGEIVMEVFTRLEGEISENRGLDRVEVWVNGALSKEIGAAWMGLSQYWFLDTVDGAELSACNENIVEVRAYDTGGNEGRDQVTITYLGPGDIEIVSIDPVQVLFGAPLVKGKSTAFRAKVNSSFACEVSVHFRLELPDGQWRTNPPSTGAVITGIPPDWSYPEMWGPVPIPAGASDFEVMLPYISPGEESEGFGLSTNPAGLLQGEDVRGIYGPNVRVVPRPEADAVSFAIEIDPENKMVETDETNNRLDSGVLEVRTTKSLRLYFVPWVFELYPTPLETISDYQYYLQETGYADMEARLEAVQDAESMGSVPLSLVVSDSDLERLDREARRYVDYFLATYPIADSKISYRIAETFYFQEEYLADKGHNPCFNGPFISDMHDTALLADPGVDVVILFRLFGCCGQSPGVYVDAGLELTGDPAHWIHQRTNPDLDPGDEHYYCWNWDFPLGGAADYVIGHELCHFLLGMPGECYLCGDPAHLDADCTYCQTDVDGFWVNRWMPIPQGTPYFMESICSGCLFWTRLEPSRKKNGVENPDGYLNAIEVFSSAADPVSLLVRGQITKEDEVSLKPFVILPDSNLDLTAGGNGDHYIVLYDVAGNVLSKWGFFTSFVTYDPQPRLPEELSLIHFGYRVEWQEGTHRVEIQDAQGRVLASREVTANAPQVKILSPNGGEVWNEDSSYKIKWEATDADGDPLLFSLALSRDGGETWIPLSIDLEDTQYEIKTNGLQTGENYLIKVFATDGVNTGEDISDAVFSMQVKGASTSSPLLLVGLAVLGIVGLGMVFAGLVLARKRGRS
ncbi:MAG: hypothetical protein A2Z14_07775 [Chloroflexi bacterium RBG_16_48_8]|nr:MAG: hypothetical protein A2Z14_07775 [Chloroflexi bacterium RBG_16_48_8]